MKATKPATTAPMLIKVVAAPPVNADGVGVGLVETVEVFELPVELFELLVELLLMRVKFAQVRRVALEL